MSEAVADMLPQSTQKILLEIQRSMLPMLQSLGLGRGPIQLPERSSEKDERSLFRHTGKIGTLVVRRTTTESLRVSLAAPVANLEADYKKQPQGLIEPMPLFAFHSFAVYMQAQNTHFSSRYIPKRWPDNGVSLESERYGALAWENVLDLQQMVGDVMEEVATATAKAQQPVLGQVLLPTGTD